MKAFLLMAFFGVGGGDIFVLVVVILVFVVILLWAGIGEIRIA